MAWAKAYSIIHKKLYIQHNPNFDNTHRTKTRKKYMKKLRMLWVISFSFEKFFYVFFKDIFNRESRIIPVGVISQK